MTDKAANKGITVIARPYKLCIPIPSSHKKQFILTTDQYAAYSTSVNSYKNYCQATKDQPMQPPHLHDGSTSDPYPSFFTMDTQGSYSNDDIQNS